MAKKINKIKIRNRYYDVSETSIDTYTNEPELLSKLNLYLDIDNSIKYSSNTVNIYNHMDGNIYPICYSRIVNNLHEFIINNKVYHNIVYNHLRKQGKPANKIYEIKDYNFKEEVALTSLNVLDLPEFTLGLELETSSSAIPKEEMEKIGFASLYDGSITGPEYTSVILDFSKLHYVHRAMQLLKRMSTYDKYCSLHIHFGNILYSDDNLLAIYNLYQRLQDELNYIIAPFRKDYKYLASKDKDHCKNLPKLLNNNVNDILQLFHLNDVGNLEDYRNSRDKWNLKGRYFNINFINYICNKPESKTVEIRPLQMTTNFDYFLTFLLVNYCIINYAINNTNKINNKEGKIELLDVINYSKINIDIKSILKSNIENVKNLFYNLYHINNVDTTDLYVLDNKMSKILKPYNLYPELSLDTLYSKLIKLDYKEYTKIKKSITKPVNHLDLITKSKLYSGEAVSENTTFQEFLTVHEPPLKDICEGLCTTIANLVEYSGIHFNNSTKLIGDDKQLVKISTSNYSKNGNSINLDINFKINDNILYDVVRRNCNLYRDETELLIRNFENINSIIKTMVLNNYDVLKVETYGSIRIKRLSSISFLIDINGAMFKLPVSKNILDAYIELYQIQDTTIFKDAYGYEPVVAQVDDLRRGPGILNFLEGEIENLQDEEE
jgi:hypothetical protein